MDEVRSDATVTTAPPPPTEVKIRTMKTDLASMTASGGGLPKYQNVHVTGLSAQKESKQDATTTAGRTESKSNLLLIVLFVLIVAALVIVGWFLYLKFKG